MSKFVKLTKTEIENLPDQDKKIYLKDLDSNAKNEKKSVSAKARRPDSERKTRRVMQRAIAKAQVIADKQAPPKEIETKAQLADEAVEVVEAPKYNRERERARNLRRWAKENSKAA